MTYLIDQKVFYWINVLSSLRGCMVAFIIVGIIVATISWITYFMYCDDEGEGYLKSARILSMVIIVLGVVGVVFIPDKETLIVMLVAKTATVENVGWTVDALKEAVDYIVEAIAKIKG